MSALTTNEALAVLTSYHLSDADLRRLATSNPVEVVTNSPKFDTSRLLDVTRAAARAKASVLPVSFPVRSRAAGLWKIGSITRNRRVMIVNSKEASPEAIDAAYDLTRACALLGIDIVSDLACAADEATHRATMSAHAHPIAVLSHPVTDVPFEFASSARRIAGSGALLSAYAPGLTVEPEFCVERAQTAASLSQLVVVTSAATTVSGPGAAARRARAIKVPVAALRGSPGCDALIASGYAYPIDNRDDLLRLLAALYERPTGR